MNFILFSQNMDSPLLKEKDKSDVAAASALAGTGEKELKLRYVAAAASALAGPGEKKMKQGMQQQLLLWLKGKKT